jgi:hypothetical protein
MGGPFGYDQRHAEEEVVAEWEEALESEHQRQAKVIVMEAIAAAERRGRKQGWNAAIAVLEENGYHYTAEKLSAMPCPEKE